MDQTAQNIRDAASVIVLRHLGGAPHVLMGQRGASAAFMPSKYVFPGGALDPQDLRAPLSQPLDPRDHARLNQRSNAAPEALLTCALRELSEETGLSVHARATAHFFFRAVTPQGRPRRFDARFFLLPAEAITSDLDDFFRAEDELSHLHWVPLAQARALDLPFITEVVLAEVSALAAQGPLAPPPDGVPFFDNSGPKARFLRLL